jgi:NitT/TauT family transport system substrate-binding protein
MLIATACAPPIASAPAATPTAVPLTHVIVAYSNVSATILPEWVAQNEGIFQKHGLDVDLQYAASATSVSALVSGQMQVATVGLSEVVGAIAGGADLVVVATQVPGYAYVFEVAPDIQTADDLKGKAVGISRTGSSSDIATRVVLKKLGLDPEKDVTLVQTGSNTERAAAVQSGAIQAAVAGPPDNLAAERQGWHPLFDLAGMGLPAVTLGLVVQRSWRDSNQATLQAYVDSVVEAIARTRADKQVALDLLRQNANIASDEDLNVTYDYYTSQRLLPSLPYPRPEQFTDTLEVLGQSDEKVANLNIPPLLDSTFVSSAEQRGLAGQ